jgi:hypothetical protein
MEIFKGNDRISINEKREAVSRGNTIDCVEGITYDI